MRKHNRKLLLFICSNASLSGVIPVYDASVISGVIEPVTEHLHLSPWQSGWAVSNVILGCIAGAACVSALSDRIGRKPTLVLTALLFTLSATGSALADTLTEFVLYRLIGGLAVGMASAITPLYIAELSPKEWRGRMLGLQQMLMVAGQVTVYVVNYLIARGMSHAGIVSEGWRWMLAGVAFCLSAVDRWGRTRLLRWGALGCALSLMVTSWAFISQTGGLLAVIGLVAFVLIFGMSWSLVTDHRNFSEPDPRRRDGVCLLIDGPGHFHRNSELPDDESQQPADEPLPRGFPADAVCRRLSGGFLVCAAFFTGNPGRLAGAHRAADVFKIPSLCH